VLSVLAQLQLPDHLAPLPLNHQCRRELLPTQLLQPQSPPAPWLHEVGPVATVAAVVVVAALMQAAGRVVATVAAVVVAATLTQL
jgi:hypothetical protein